MERDSCAAAKSILSRGLHAARTVKAPVLERDNASDQCAIAAEHAVLPSVVHLTTKRVIACHAVESHACGTISFMPPTSARAITNPSKDF